MGRSGGSRGMNVDRVGGMKKPAMQGVSPEHGNQRGPGQHTKK